MRILFLDLDTLRPDHLSCYGYRRNTSPNIDVIAAQGVRFTNYHCSDAPCLPSRAALMSGRFGFHTGVVGHGGTAADMRLEGPRRRFRDRMDKESLPAILRQAGLKTALVSPFAERHSAWWFYAGFTEMYNTGMGGMESAELVSPTALDWIARHGAEDNWYLHVNYWDPHTPYRAPAEFGDPFKDDPLPAWLTEEVIEKHRRMVGGHGIREISMFNNVPPPGYPRHLGEIKDMADLRQFIDGYDCGIRYMDEHIGRLFNALADQNALADLIVIITSDHGENLGELNLYGEHATADEITTRIPMIVRWPGNAAGHADDGFHYNLDLIPTLAEQLNLPASPNWDGQSYAPALRGEACGRDELIVSQCAHTCQRGVRFGPWLYLRTWHDFYHLFPTEMLFNIEQDPHEECDVANERPDLCREGAYRLLGWTDAMMRAMPEGYTVDPIWTVMSEGGPEHSRGQLKQYLEFLRETGREEAIPELERRYPHELTD